HARAEALRKEIARLTGHAEPPAADAAAAAVDEPEAAATPPAPEAEDVPVEETPRDYVERRMHEIDAAEAAGDEREADEAAPAGPADDQEAGEGVDAEKPPSSDPGSDEAAPDDGSR